MEFSLKMKLLLVILAAFIVVSSAYEYDDTNRKIAIVPYKFALLLNQHLDEFKNFSISKNITKSGDVTSLREINMKIKNLRFGIGLSTKHDRFVNGDTKIDFEITVNGIVVEGPVRAFEAGNFSYDGYARCLPKVNSKIEVKTYYNHKLDDEITPLSFRNLPSPFVSYQTDVIINCPDQRYGICMDVKNDIQALIEDQLLWSVFNKVKTLIPKYTKDISKMIAAA